MATFLCQFAADIYIMYYTVNLNQILFRVNPYSPYKCFNRRSSCDPRDLSFLAGRRLYERRESLSELDPEQIIIRQLGRTKLLALCCERVNIDCSDTVRVGLHVL